MAARSTSPVSTEPSAYLRLGSALREAQRHLEDAVRHSGKVWGQRNDTRQGIRELHDEVVAALSVVESEYRERYGIGAGPLRDAIRYGYNDAPPLMPADLEGVPGSAVVTPTSVISDEDVSLDDLDAAVDKGSTDGKEG